MNIPPLALRFRHNAVFLLRLGLYAHIVLSYPAQHICALANIDDFAADLNAIDASPLVFCIKPFALHPVVYIIRIGWHQNTNPFYSGFDR